MVRWTDWMDSQAGGQAIGENTVHPVGPAHPSEVLDLVH